MSDLPWRSRDPGCTPASRPSWSRSPPSRSEQVEVRPGDEIDDPYGRSAAAYTACAERLDGLVSTAVAALAGTVAAGDGYRWAR
jgi:hypothetical protein